MFDNIKLDDMGKYINISNFIPLITKKCILVLPFLKATWKKLLELEMCISFDLVDPILIFPQSNIHTCMQGNVYKTILCGIVCNKSCTIYPVWYDLW